MWALWTHTNIEQIVGHMTTFNAYEAGAKYAITPALTGALGYTYMQAKDLTNGHWNQIDASVDYALSKRTDVYLLGVFQDAKGKTSTGASPAIADRREHGQLPSDCRREHAVGSSRGPASQVLSGIRVSGRAVRFPERTV